MSDQEQKQEEISLSNEELDAKIKALEETVLRAEKLRKLESLTKRQRELESVDENLELVNATFEDAIAKEQIQVPNLRETREQRIERLERETIDLMKTGRFMCINDQYPQYYFSSLNTSKEDEKVRRFWFHADRMPPEEFMKKYKNEYVFGFLTRKYNNYGT